MKIGIIGAMQMEVDNLKEALENQTTETVSGVNFVSGNIGDVEVVAAVCGVGKVFAAICAEAMILKYAPDMVINIGALKNKRYQEIEDEIRAIHEACNGKILKVIIETCLLTEEEKIKMCEIVTNAGAEYIKTSTGFSTGGATFDDVALMRKHIGAEVKVKAAGGISSFDDAEKFMSLGADRLGTSRLIKIMKNTDTGAGY